MLRTHTCNSLGEADIKKEVRLAGWMHSRRDHGNLIFVDLRDRYGLTQIVFDPKDEKTSHEVAGTLRREDVINISGTVRSRGEGLENPRLKTGKIEVLVTKIDIITRADTPPLEIDDRVEAGEEARMKYRYLDLRRPKMVRQLEFRHKVTQIIRSYFNSNHFIEIETPLLVKSTPEGARDYVVPSRTNPGKFFALPQSPQLYKQILMIAGIDRYYQLARCLRDEDLRADRQPEHTQMDLEMSFVDEKDIMEFVEGLYHTIFNEALGAKLQKFQVLTHKESMDKYGIDKPDLRFGLELMDVTELAEKSDFQVFKDVVKNKGIVKCINPTDMPRKEIDALIEFTQKHGAKGMAWMRVTKDGLDSNIAKFFNKDLQKALIEKTKAKEGTVLLFIADQKKKANEVLAVLRNELGKKLNLIKEGEWKFCWIVDFPLFAWNEDEQKYEPEHHMFSSPKQESMQYLEKDPGKVLGNLFDLVLNGTELGSGSIRVHDPIVQKRIMKVIGMTEEEAQEKFGFLLDAYKYGAPTHGGMGLGLDRLVAMMLGFNDIREVIAFPKNKNAECPMDGCPGDIAPIQMKELNIASTVVKKK